MLHQLNEQLEIQVVQEWVVASILSLVLTVISNVLLQVLSAVFRQHLQQKWHVCPVVFLDVSREVVRKDLSYFQGICCLLKLELVD